MQKKTPICRKIIVPLQLNLNLLHTIMRQPSRRLLPLIFLSMLGATSMMAQESTKGRDFWFTYLYNFHETNPSWNPGEHTVNVLGSDDCTVRITEGGGRDSVSLQLNGRNNRVLLHRLGNNRNRQRRNIS